MKFYEKMNDVDYPISKVIEMVNTESDQDNFFQLRGCMHEQIFGQQHNLDRVPGIDWREAPIFNRAVQLAINMDPGEGGDQGRHLLMELIRLSFLMEEDDHCLVAMSGIRSYHEEHEDIWLRTAGYFWTWLQRKSIAYDTFTVLRDMRPQDTRLFYTLLCSIYHENSKTDDEVRALLAQCSNDFFFAGSTTH